MDHTDVLDRLATAFSEPGKLSSLDADASVEGRELQRHLDGCDACRTELAAWRLTSLALSAATPESLRAPDGARDRVLAAVAATGVARGGARNVLTAPALTPRLTSLPPTQAAPDWAGKPADMGRAADSAPLAAMAPSPTGRRAAIGRSPFRLVAIAAAVAVLLFVGGALLGPKLGLTQEAPNTDRNLTSVVTFIDSIVRKPDHLSVALYTPDGTLGGSVLVDPATGNLAMVSTALPASSQTYDCFLGRGDSKTRIGLMHFSDQTSYWIGKVASLSSPGEPGDWIEVRLGGVGGELSLHGSF